MLKYNALRLQSGCDAVASGMGAARSPQRWCSVTVAAATQPLPTCHPIPSSQSIAVYCIPTNHCFSSSSSFGATARCGLWPVEQCPFFPIYHQLSPSSHAHHLKISFYFSPSFPGSCPSSRPL